MDKKGFALKFTLLALAFVLVFCASFFIGRYKIGLPSTWTIKEVTVIKNIRFPRIICASLIGAALSIAGA